MLPQLLMTVPRSEDIVNYGWTMQFVRYGERDGMLCHCTGRSASQNDNVQNVSETRSGDADAGLVAQKSRKREAMAAWSRPTCRQSHADDVWDPLCLLLAGRKLRLQLLQQPLPHLCNHNTFHLFPLCSNSCWRSQSDVAKLPTRMSRASCSFQHMTCSSSGRAG